MLKVVKADEKITPHLAVTHEAQGGPANGRKVSLLMKSEDELSDEVKDILKTLLKSQDPKDEVVKAASYQALYRKLEVAVEADAKSKDGWGWAYVRDFDDGIVVYSGSGGVNARSYTEDSDGKITLGDDITSVNEMITYEDSSGNLVLTQSDSISSKVSGLVVKSFSSDKEDMEKLKDVFKTKFMEEKTMNELQKSLDTANATIEELKVSLEKAQAEAAAAVAALAEVEKAKAVEKSAKRLEVLKAVVAEDQLEALHKSLEALGDESFDTVVKSMESAKKASEEASGLFTQVSKSNAQPVEQAPNEGLIALLKAHNPKTAE